MNKDFHLDDERRHRSHQLRRRIQNRMKQIWDMTEELNSHFSKEMAMIPLTGGLHGQDKYWNNKSAVKY
jgi:hypothetical protein